MNKEIKQLQTDKFVITFEIDSPTIKTDESYLLVEINDSIPHDSKMREARKEAMKILKERNNLEPEDIIISKVSGDVSFAFKNVIKKLTLNRASAMV